MTSGGELRRIPRPKGKASAGRFADRYATGVKAPRAAGKGRHGAQRRVPEIQRQYRMALDRGKPCAYHVFISLERTSPAGKMAVVFYICKHPHPTHQPLCRCRNIGGRSLPAGWAFPDLPEHFADCTARAGNGPWDGRVGRRRLIRRRRRADKQNSEAMGPEPWLCLRCSQTMGE